MNIQRLHYIKIAIFGFKKILELNKDYLKSGKYLIKENFCTIYNEEMKQNNQISTFIDLSKNTNIIKKIISKLVSLRKYKLKDSGKKGTGEIIIISSSRNEYKIFDFKNSKLINRYIKREKYLDIKDKYSYISNLYKTPRIMEQNDEEQVTIEDYINGENICERKQDIYEKILTHYIKIGSKFEKGNIISNTCNKKFLKYNIFKKMEEIIKESKELSNIPTIKCHGDLWSANIIYKDNEIYYIDYEMTGYYSFLYDLFFFIFSEAYLKNDYLLINNYINGNYDNELKTYFKIFNVEYNSSKKNEYLLFFILEYANNKWKNMNNRGLKYEIEKLQKLLNRLNIIF